MFYFESEVTNLMVYSFAEVQKYLEVAAGSGSTIDNSFIMLRGVEIDSKDNLYIRSSLTRDELYKIMGYQVYDFAFPQPWADSPAGAEAFRGAVPNWKRGDRYPSLVWCYDPPKGSDRQSIFGYPVFDTHVIRDLGKMIRGMINQGVLTWSPFPWSDDQDPDLYWPSFADMPVSEVKS